MEERFCSFCGTARSAQARFCVKCGKAFPGVGRTARSGGKIGPWAPAIVVAAIVAVGGMAVWIGRGESKSPPPVLRKAPQEAALPSGHPPIAMPERVRAMMRRMAEQAKAKPKDQELWAHLAAMQYRAGQIEPPYLEQAQASYQHLLGLDPDNADVLRILGNIAFDRKQPKRAAEQYEKYVRLKPGDLNVRTDLGTMYLSMGNTAKAVETYRKVLADDPKFFQAQFNLAIAFRTAGEKDKALEALDAAQSLATDAAQRGQVDRVRAQLAAAVSSGSQGFRADVESIFRNHAIVGPKVERVEWPDDHTLKVYLREFPWENMPSAVRDRFVSRIGSSVRERQTRYHVAGAMQLELLDSATGDLLVAVPVNDTEA